MKPPPLSLPLDTLPHPHYLKYYVMSLPQRHVLRPLPRPVAKVDFCPASQKQSGGDIVIIIIIIIIIIIMIIIIILSL